MTSLPTAATVDHLAHRLAVAETAVKESCIAYAAGRITARETRETRERRDALREEHRTALVDHMRRTAEGREELAAADALVASRIGWHQL